MKEVVVGPYVGDDQNPFEYYSYDGRLLYYAFFLIVLKPRA